MSIPKAYLNQSQSMTDCSGAARKVQMSLEHLPISERTERILEACQKHTRANLDLLQLTNSGTF